MRLQVWLNGLLAGGNSLAEVVKPWHEGFSIYNGVVETFAGDQEEVPEDDAKLREEPLMAAISRLRQRREQSGNEMPEIHVEEQR